MIGFVGLIHNCRGILKANTQINYINIVRKIGFVNNRIEWQKIQRIWIFSSQTLVKATLAFFDSLKSKAIKVDLLLPEAKWP